MTDQEADCPLSFLFFHNFILNICLFIYLAAQGLCYGTQDLQLWYVGSSSLTKDQTWHWEAGVLATGPAGKSLGFFIFNQLSFMTFKTLGEG